MRPKTTRKADPLAPPRAPKADPHSRVCALCGAVYTVQHGTVEINHHQGLCGLCATKKTAIRQWWS